MHIIPICPTRSVYVEYNTHHHFNALLSSIALPSNSNIVTDFIIDEFLNANHSLPCSIHSIISLKHREKTPQIEHKPIHSWSHKVFDYTSSKLGLVPFVNKKCISHIENILYARMTSLALVHGAETTEHDLS